MSTGQLLCAGLFSLDSMSNWFAAIGLSHSLIDNPVQRELMLKVMLTPSISSAPVSFLSLITDLLQNVSWDKTVEEFGNIYLINFYRKLI